MENGIFEKSIVVFGAGKIGRSFIGQLFSKAGYKVVFIDIASKVINELNRRGSYNVIIKSENEEVIKVRNVSGVLATDKKSVADAIVNCHIIATCVGKNALLKIMPLIAKGIEARYSANRNSPIDIILAENIRDACQIVEKGFKQLLPLDFPVNKYIGLVETSIGKMVPIMPKEIEDIDPLLVYAEPYNTLIVGKLGFINPVPNVEGLSAKENIKAWVDRKAFIHNLGHAAAAYYGFYKCPDKKYLYEVLEDNDVLAFTIEVMQQAADALILEYPDEFTTYDLHNHIDDLIFRFRNKALGDTIFRVGSDLKRKLSSNDRIVGAIRLAQKVGGKFDKLLEVLVFGLLFRACDEFKQLFPGDQELVFQIKENLNSVLTEICGFDTERDKETIKTIKNIYTELKLDSVVRGR